jgi:hypothetical protein
LHCLLHSVGGIDFVAGDLRDQAVAKGTFGLIDAYGVLHHLEDPLAGLQALGSRLCEGGIIRVMVYSRYTRREEESIRRALRLLKVHEPEQVRSMVARSKEGSRLRRFFEESDEVSYRSGLADALLHPCVSTYRIDDFMKMVTASGLEPLLFAHPLALPEPSREVERIRALEAKRKSPGNFVLYLGRNTKGPCPDSTATFQINPCLSRAISLWRLGTLHIPGRLGQRSEPLGAAERRFLRRFRRPVKASELSVGELAKAHRYSEQLLLLRYSK